MAVKSHPEVRVEKLRWTCDPKTLGFKNTNELKPAKEIIGQKRAMQAIKLGLEVGSPGYNIYVAGLTGTGKSTTVKTILESIDKTAFIPDDICYVYNFENPDAPMALFLKAGKGSAFQNDMAELVLDLRNKLPKLLESDTFKKRQKKVLEQYQEKSVHLISEFEKRVRKEGLAVVQLQVGQITRPELMPLVNNEVVPWQQLEGMVGEGKFDGPTLEKLKAKHEELLKDLEDTMRENRRIEKDIQNALRELRHIFIQPIITGIIYELKEKYQHQGVSEYLDSVEHHMIDNFELFTQQPDGNEQQASPFSFLMSAPKGQDLVEYKVNVFVDNSRLKRRPVIIETAPNYKNLFGTIERLVDRQGIVYTDFTKVKAGSLARAHGGYLVLNLIDVLNEAGVWNALKRTLKNRKLDIQAYDPFYVYSQVALKPQAIDIEVKVMLIGDAYLYQMLLNYDEDFRKVFKIRADFDTVMSLDKKAQSDYAHLIKRLCDDEKLLAFDASGVARIIEHGVRLAGRQNKVTTRFSDIADTMREASYWAQNAKAKFVTAAHVDKALDEKRYRKNLIEDKIQEMIDEGSLLIDSDGMKTGQVNGLSVYDMGDYSFGKPARITATTGVGNAGIINIEREADMSGKTHNKGVLIIGGYFRNKYAHDKPLSFSASLAFEQSYSGVDGDSASSTEIYALLSELSGLPLRQDIAVTGSVNQKGEIQPIGGVNHKIEGFYDVCNARGFTDKQGVIIPHQNVDDLMLREDIVTACKKGKFHIYPVKTIDEGIEILTGVSAGQKNSKDTYPKYSIHFMVEKRLKELAAYLNKSSSAGAAKKKNKKVGKKKLT